MYVAVCVGQLVQCACGVSHVGSVPVRQVLGVYVHLMFVSMAVVYSVCEESVLL